MTDRELRVTRYVGHERIYLYTREGYKKPYGLAFAGGKVRWFASQFAIERIIATRARDNREGKKQYQARIKEGFFTCQCGCNETFQAPFKTRKPIYKDDTHRARAHADRREQKRIAVEQRKAARRRAREERNARKLTQPNTGSSPHDGRVEGGGAGEGEGASPSLRKSPPGGLWDGMTEPLRTKKRRAVGLYAYSEGTDD